MSVKRTYALQDSGLANT